MNNLLYKKRTGTSGVSGQLYETKLLSLILFRVLHGEDIEEFYIGTNVDGLGEFDDICLRFKVKGFDKPIAVFLQAKHRDDVNKCLAVNSIDLPKYFDSYLKIRNKFNVNSSDAIFKGAYDDIECAFVFYTNTRDELVKQKERNYISKINDVISTGDDAFQLAYTDDHVKLFNKMVLRAIIEQLAKLIADIVRVEGNNYKSLMNNELMQTYHVILSHRVFIDSDVQQDVNKDYRMARFNHTFFDTTDDHLKLLGEGLVAIGSSDAESRRRSACVKEYCSKSFKLPAAFGNRNLTLSREKRLCYLANKLINLLKESYCNIFNDDTFNIIHIDENFPDKGFLKLNGGLAGAVGNLLILDSKTRLLMFNDGNDLAGHARTLFDKINRAVTELDKYRFDVRVKNFPKLSFDCNEHDKSMVLHFTDRLLFCTKQARESEVEDILKRDIGRLQNTREQCNFQIKSDAIFLAYHDEIQKWWLQQNNAEYLTKTCYLFQNSIDRFIKNPLLNIANILSKNKMMKYDIMFNTLAVELLRLDASYSKITIIVSEVIALSIVKVTQYIKNDDYYLIDLNYVSSLPVNDSNGLHEELKNVKDEVFILTYRLSQVTKLNKDIKAILQLLKQKKLIVVTNSGSVSEIRKIFAHADFFIVDDKSSLVDLTKESQETITKNTDVIFQGVHVNLNVLVDDDAREFIKGELMDKIMSGEVIQVGEPLTNPLYERIKGLYIIRRVTSKRVFHGRQDDNADNDDDDDDDEVNDDDEINDDVKDDDDDSNDERQDVGTKLESFYDMNEQAVLITAEPGMGKSSLLTHLSLTTKAQDPGVWIVRIDLLDYSRFFCQWMENQAAIDLLEALRFICVALVNQNVNERLILDEKNGEICVKECSIQTDKDVIFQINMFLHFCNRRKVIFAFDGFDEICPRYEPQVIQFLNVLKCYRSEEHRIWITSRTYSKILQSLESVFDVCHLLQPFNDVEQQQFIERYLKLKLHLEEFNQKEIDKIDNFIAYMRQSHSLSKDINMTKAFNTLNLPLDNVYLAAVQYFKDEIKRVLCLQDKEKYVKAWNLDVDVMRDTRAYIDFDYDSEFITTPLHIYMMLDYFQHQIKHAETDTIWDLNLNTHTMYEHFVETKFRKIRFEEKNQMDLYKPDNQFTFESEKKKFINVHKKLAAYAMFYEHFDQLFSETELEEIRQIVSTIDSGQEKTGVIYTVINGVPRFMHQTFAEYFAVEYICDILKTEQSSNKLISLWNLIVYTATSFCYMGVLILLDDKLFIDEELKNKIRDARSRQIIFDSLMEQMNVTEISTNQLEVISRAVYYIMMWSLNSAHLHNLGSLFLWTLGLLTPEVAEGLVKKVTELVPGLSPEFKNVKLDTVRKADLCEIEEFDKFLQWYRICDDNTLKRNTINTIYEYIFVKPQ